MRINRASDDAAGLALATTINSDQQVLQQALRNTNDGISLVNVAESGVNQLSTITQRLQELAQSASNGSLSSSQREALDSEAQALSEEFNRVISTTSYNDLDVLGVDFGSISIQTGYGTTGSVGFALGDKISRTIGTGEFEDPSSVIGASVSDVEQGDANGDGILDLYYARGGSVVLRFGNGDGTFGSENTAYTFGKFDTIVAIAVGDFNNDGFVDVTGGDSDGDFFLATSDGDGTFTETYEPFTAVGYLLSDLEVADYDGDGNLDIFAVQEGNTYNSSVMFGDGAGDFSSNTSIAQNKIDDATIGDFDGDGTIDLATSWGTVTTVFFNNGDQTFQGGEVVGTASAGVSSGDINGDGVDELVTFNGATIVTHTYEEGSFSQDQTLTQETPVTAVTFADIDIDGNLDLLSLENNKSVHVRFNTDGIIGEEYSSKTIGTGLDSIAIGDFNGDGVSDLSASGTGGLYVSIGDSEESNTIDPIDISTQAGALEAMNTLDEISARVTTELGVISAAQSRLQSAFANLGTTVENLDIAQSRIRDADIAQETAELVRNQILSDTGTAILGQANIVPQVALDLLRASETGNSE